MPATTSAIQGPAPGRQLLAVEPAQRQQPEEQRRHAAGEHAGHRGAQHHEGECSVASAAALIGVQSSQTATATTNVAVAPSATWRPW
jgi:hypothetical protein